MKTPIITVSALAGLVVGLIVGATGSHLLYRGFQHFLENEAPEEAGAVTDADTKSEPSAELPSIVEQLWHPSDPGKPASAIGTTDEELAALSRPEIEQLLIVELPRIRAESPPNATHLFALGRVARMHKRNELALQLLSEAADAGSAGASHYLGEMALEGKEEDKALACFEKALAGGFKPSQVIRDEVAASIRQKTIDFRTLQFGELVKALHTGDMATLNRNRLWNLVVVTAMAEAIAESGLFGLNTNDPEQQLLQLDAGMATRARLEYGRPENQTMMIAEKFITVGGVVMNEFDSIRNSYSGSGDLADLAARVIGGAMRVSYSSQAFQARIAEFEAKGAADGKVLARTYRAGGRKDVEQIYNNMKRFIDQH